MTRPADDSVVGELSEVLGLDVLAAALTATGITVGIPVIITGTGVGEPVVGVTAMQSPQSVATI